MHTHEPPVLWFLELTKWVVIIYASAMTAAHLTAHVTETLRHHQAFAHSDPTWAWPQANMQLVQQTPPPMPNGIFDQDMFQGRMGEGLPPFTNFVRAPDAPPGWTDSDDGSPIEIPVEIGVTGMEGEITQGVPLDFDGLYGPKPPLPYQRPASVPVPPPNRGLAEREARRARDVPPPVTCGFCGLPRVGGCACSVVTVPPPPSPPEHAEG